MRELTPECKRGQCGRNNSFAYAGINSIREKYGLALGFPIFTGKIRVDKNPENATEVEELTSMYKQQRRKKIRK